MDLRPINPYYKQAAKTRSVDAYTYQYTWIDPVVDRTEADIEHVKELLEKPWATMSEEQQQAYTSGLKGCMNRADFERIENNIQILLDVLEIDEESYVDAIPEFLTESYFAKMKSNVEAIRNGYATHNDTPAIPQLPFNTWQKYNDIEKILADVYEVVCAQLKYYAGGEIYAGDTVGLIL